MTKADDLRELRSFVAETMMSADDVIKILKEDEGAAVHYRLMRWLMPQAQKTLEQLRKGEQMTIESKQMLPVEALAIVMDHFDYIVEDTLAAMTDEEYERMVEMGRRGEF